MRKQRKILYRMEVINSIRNRYLRRFLMIFMTPVLFIINLIVALIIALFMGISLFVLASFGNSKVLFSSIKEKW